MLDADARVPGGHRDERRSQEQRHDQSLFPVELRFSGRHLFPGPERGDDGGDGGDGGGGGGTLATRRGRAHARAGHHDPVSRWGRRGDCRLPRWQRDAARWRCLHDWRGGRDVVLSRQSRPRCPLQGGAQCRADQGALRRAHPAHGLLKGSTNMPTYLGQEVSQAFLDYILWTYKEGYIAAHPTHAAPAEDDATLLANMEGTVTLGGPDADAMARYLANPPIAGQSFVAGHGQVWQAPLAAPDGSTVNA